MKSYSLWKGSKFREATGFSGLSNKEQDKIFNDLEITALIYTLLFLEDRASKKNDKDDVVYLNIGEYIISAFLELMVGAQVSNTQLKLWRKLIELRQREYRKNVDYTMKESREWGVFEPGDKLLHQVWGRILALSLGTLKHIKHDSKASIKDPLWPVLRRWLVGLEVELTQIFKDTDLRELKVLN